MPKLFDKISYLWICFRHLTTSVVYDHSVLFISRRNVIRAPIAKAVFTKILKDQSLMDMWQVDSAAIDVWQLGNEIDERAMEVLRLHNYEIDDHKARQISNKDFFQYEYMLVMDEGELFDLSKLAPVNSKTIRQLLGTFDPSGDIYIDDPYFTKGMKPIIQTLLHCQRSCENFLRQLQLKSKK
ncbi:unnamed protein product [Nezara viridula]|uniref:Phosphotyrosine protein phosphatase I domain-containing protein n=1 Tax=Nezara viridula TaxID=85310 RepID=A0A9P0E5N0_NEZVI|nr:unnamed protein product [Nezara viridula]